MLHTKFQASEAKGYKEEGFEYCFMYFCASNTGQAVKGLFSDLHLNKIPRGPQGNVLFQISSL